MSEIYTEIGFYIIGFGLFNSYIFFLMNKFKVLDFYTYYRPRWFPHCNMCLFFWMGCIDILLFTHFVLTLPLLFFYSCCCAVITRKFSI
jgi:hypothetical protein